MKRAILLTFAVALFSLVAWFAFTNGDASHNANEDATLERTRSETSIVSETSSDDGPTPGVDGSRREPRALDPAENESVGATAAPSQENVGVDDPDPRQLDLPTALEQIEKVKAQITAEKRAIVDKYGSDNYRALWVPSPLKEDVPEADAQTFYVYIARGDDRYFVPVTDVMEPRVFELERQREALEANPLVAHHLETLRIEKERRLIEEARRESEQRRSGSGGSFPNR